MANYPVVLQPQSRSCNAIRTGLSVDGARNPASMRVPLTSIMTGNPRVCISYLVRRGSWTSFTTVVLDQHCSRRLLPQERRGKTLGSSPRLVCLKDKFIRAGRKIPVFESANRLGGSSRKRLVNLHVLTRHSLAREAAFELSTDLYPIQGRDPANRPYRLLDGIDNEP